MYPVFACKLAVRAPLKVISTKGICRQRQVLFYDFMEIFRSCHVRNER